LAVAAWFEQSIYFDYETGLPTSGKEQEAYEFLNMINLETAKVGFGISGDTVIGLYCPAANTDPEALKLNTPKERVAPVEPEAPLGVDLAEGVLCPELDDTGRRANCAEGMCCGMSTSTTDETKTIDHCMPEDTGSHEKDGDSWSFECYQGAQSLMVSLGAVLISFTLTYF
jgi:hypothetical protein